MDRLAFEKGVFRNFLEDIQTKLKLRNGDLAKLLKVSERTIRDWKREKYNPTKKALERLSLLADIDLPPHKVLNQFWYVHKGASLGGKRRYELYGVLGTREDRVKGGRASWLKRKNNPQLWHTWKKYRYVIKKPEESSELAELFGIILGDGGLTHFQCTIYLNSDTDYNYAIYVRNLIKNLFNLTPSITKSKRDKVLRVSISSVDLIEYLMSKGLKLGNKVLLQVDVPGWIKSKPEYTNACIRGLIDTDGCFVIHKYQIKEKTYAYPKISFSNKSLPILNFVYQNLIENNFTPKIVLNKQVWLYNQNEVRQYLNKIGTRNHKPSVLKILEGGPDGKVAVC